jgi:hypothetical protein
MDAKYKRIESRNLAKRGESGVLAETKDGGLRAA